ncbi:zinc finger protein 184 [Papilio machaon]|uniref:zinc finger protein 184 n=1 Tax=Papilio machaon TaxID=76193 RepID=UPI001E66391D|nr:zinc finger protein 184 [Papilio machaon]
MLHNSGPFGPNEVPINMGAPVNMTPMSGTMNISNNINNLSKIGQQSTETPNAHYPVPNYTTYGHPHLNMNPTMSPFPSYPPIGFQSSYLPQSPSSVHDTNWQNGMLPMGLNMQNDNGTLNYSSSSMKRPDTMSEYKEHNLHNKMSLHIPQVHTKAFHKHINMENNHYNHYQHYSPSPSTFRQYADCNLDLSTKSKTEMDPRRKSLETTVKLIENILINSTRKNDTVQTKITEDTFTNPKPASPIQSHSNNDSLKTSQNNLIETQKEVDKPMKEVDKADFRQEKDTIDMRDDDSISNSLICREDILSTSQTSTIEEETSDTESEPQPEDLTSNAVEKQDMIIDTRVEVTVEETRWVDTESNPFLKDVNGLQKEDVENTNVITSDKSVDEATEVIKNGLEVEKYYTCPSCSLLFKHPKRFLIHHKWHSFGLGTIKKLDMAREKEMKKTLRREARVIQRMNMNEVTDMNASGKKYSCKDCDKVFSARGSLKNHRQRYHPTRVRDCKICGKTVLGWIALRAHLTTHTTDSGYQCSDCPKRFKYSHSLAKHRDTHLEKTHGCEQCPKMFGSVKLLKMHMKTHERVLRGTTFHCTYCGKGFFESYSLQVHERTHRNERPFLCEICNTSFGTNSSLKRHLKVSHNSAKPFECPTCHRSFVSAEIRERHEQRVHGDPDSFKFPCNQCPCRYLKAKDLRKHMYKAHPKGKRKRKMHSDTE